jgi:hypothetical protein
MKKDMMTTLVSVVNLVVFMGLVVSLIAGWLEKTLFYEILAVMGTLSVSVLGYFAKDKTGS